jgi:hypothetical protein
VQPAGGPVPDELPPAALEALARGRRLEAVKIVRQAYGVGLKEAKSRVDVYELGRPSAHPSAPRGDGGLRRVALLLALAAAAVMLYGWLTGNALPDQLGPAQARVLLAAGC